MSSDCRFAYGIITFISFILFFGCLAGINKFPHPILITTMVVSFLGIIFSLYLGYKCDNP